MIPIDNEIVSYIEMCQREGLSLQRGMNFGVGRGYSIILMSRRPGAPYVDQVQDYGRILIYEGHDVPKEPNRPDPKLVDQMSYLPSGKLTENGKFMKAAEEAKLGLRSPERVRVYEKIRDGIWAYNGVFDLFDSWSEMCGGRMVFKFKLIVATTSESILEKKQGVLPHRRIIPTAVKLSVWQRDAGKCVQCSSTDNLHFDHIIPYSRGGSSLTVENVQLLCSRHNLQKHDSIL